MRSPRRHTFPHAIILGLAASMCGLTGCGEPPVAEINAQLTISEIAPVVDGSFVWGVYAEAPDSLRLSFFGRVTVGSYRGPVAFAQFLTASEAAQFADGFVVVPSAPASVGYENGGGSYRVRAVESLELALASEGHLELAATLGAPIEANPSPGPATVSMVLVTTELPGCYLDGGTVVRPATADDWASSACAGVEATLGLTPLLDAVFAR